MEEKRTAKIDFDTWSEIARTNPQAFEAMRVARIQSVIDSAPEASRERLRCLQWRIDQERRLARTPMAACLKISGMMWRAVLGPNGLKDRVSELETLINGRAHGVAVAPPPSGRVVSFSPRPLSDPSSL